VQKDITGSPQVILDPFDEDLWPGSILCEVESGYEQGVSKLQSGDIARIMGICEGNRLLGTITISGCGPHDEKYERLLVKDQEKQAARDRELAERRAAEEAEEMRALAEENRRKRPSYAANKLRLAKNLKNAGKDDGYRKFLTQIVEQYPETDAAREAGELLDGG
jgi:hypothetical protein